ncbi:MAG: DUF1963 domain-containing protein [Clostridiales bacterium]|nr:DUF1963 domain-containing protein [Candidatus Cacconaster stercorequi]
MKDNKKMTGLRKLGVILLSIGMLLFAMALVLRIFRLGDWSMWLILGIIPTMMGVIFFIGGKEKRSAPTPVKRLERKELDAAQKEKMDTIIAHVKEQDSILSYHIEEVTKDEPVALTDSKFGGYPYWTADREYPTAANGENLFLLAQINFEQLAPEDNLLPKTGILQFFVQDEDLCGANFDDPTDQSGFRVIYHAEIKEPLSVEEMRALGIKANTDQEFKESMLPTLHEDAIRFVKTKDYFPDISDAFEDKMKEAMSMLYGWNFDGTLYHELTTEEYSYLTEPFSPFGHKMLGYPAFTQCDPRWPEAEVPEGKKANTIEHYDTLLFQMDSLGNVMWGDDGVANFFINSEDLKNLNFSDVLYNWDCY